MTSQRYDVMAFPSPMQLDARIHGLRYGRCRLSAAFRSPRALTDANSRPSGIAAKSCQKQRRGATALFQGDQRGRTVVRRRAAWLTTSTREIAPLPIRLSAERIKLALSAAASN